MPTSYPSCAIVNAASDRLALTADTALDLSTFTYGVLMKIPTGYTMGSFLSRHTTSASAGWECRIQTGTLYAKWEGTSDEDNSFASTIAADTWTWVFLTWDGTSFGVRSGPFMGTLAARTRSRDNVGSSLTSQVGLTLRLAEINGYHDALFTNNIAFAGVWSGVLSGATIDSYAADMNGNGGLAAAVEYWKWASGDTAGITGAKLALAGTYTSITIGTGPGDDTPTSGMRRHQVVRSWQRPAKRLVRNVLTMGHTLIETGPTYPPLPGTGGDDSTDILRIKRHRTMPHRGG